MAEPGTTFEFLRPWFLLALLAVPLGLWWLRRRRSAGRSWQHAVDAHLLPHLLESTGARQPRSWTRWSAALAATLAILALAGPSLRQTTAPLWQTEAPLVVALDLSAAMRTADLRPTRLAQAKARLKTLFDERRGGQIGLLVYAGDAFTVAPITRDAQTLGALLDSLQPDIMPIEGQRADLAIAHAVQMLKAARYLRGDILLISDHADPAALAAARRAVQDGFAVSVLGVGTSAGAPLANASGFVTDAAGKVQLARLDADSLAALARAGGGRYATLVKDGSDLRQLDLLDAHGASAARADNSAADRTLTRSDDGYWLLLPVLALALGLLRRGVLLLAMLACSAALVIPVGAARADPPPTNDAAAPASAAPAVQSGGWAAWWQRADQRARQALDAGDAASARALAADPALKASAAYRSEDYEAAAQAWGDLPQADAHYNRGNALARAGKLKEALAAYDEALAAQPQMDDAIANRQAVADALRQQDQQKKQQQQQQGSKQDQQDGSGQQGEQQDPQDGGQQSQQGDPQQGDQPGQQGQEQTQSQDQQQDGQQGQSNDAPAQQDQSGKDGASSSESSGAEKEAKPQSGPARDGEKGDDGAKKDASAGEEKPSAEDQQRARDALREQMQQALEHQQQDAGAAEDGASQAAQEAASQRPLTAEERAELEKSQALQQWLRRVPDDPGGLLRRKFAREYQQRQQREGDPQ